MAQMFDIQVKGAMEARTRFAKRAMAIRRGATRTLHNVALAGKNYAKAIAPRDTGALIRAIIFRSSKNEAWLTSSQPNHPKTGTAIPYHVLMHYDAKIASRIKSGDPRYMFTTTKWLRKRFPAHMRQMIHTAIEGTGFVKTEA